VVLNLVDGVPVEQIATLRPDLIVATNAGLDRDTYNKLTAIAPTIAQSGQDAFFEPWKVQAGAIGQAVFKHDEMQSLIAGIEEKFAAVGKNNEAQFAGKAVLLAEGRLVDGEIKTLTPAWRGDFLSAMGFTITDDADSADVIIWSTESDEEQAAILADPVIAKRDPKRNVFTGKELAGAIAYASTLSYPVVTDRLPGLIATALT
jgi:iron complex transport system substrate-binding protein